MEVFLINPHDRLSGGRLVCHNFLNFCLSVRLSVGRSDGWEVTLQCSYPSTCLNVKSVDLWYDDQGIWQSYQFFLLWSLPSSSSSFFSISFSASLIISFYLYMYLFIYLSNYLSKLPKSIYLSIYLSIYISFYLSINPLTIYLPLNLSIFLSFLYPFLFLSSIYLSWWSEHRLEAPYPEPGAC